MEDKTVELTLLFDFFGELLPAKQREYFDLYYNEDLSLSEIAENAGISRQGVRDALVHGERALRAYEEKTGVLARFNAMQRELDRLCGEASRLREMVPEGEGRALADGLLSGLEHLKG